MTLTVIDTDHWHARYRALEVLAQEEEDRGDRGEVIAPIKDAIDRAWQAIADAFALDGFQANNSDPAEEMIAALTRYFFVSNRNDLTAHVALLIDAKTLF